jgi:putative flippase GtrA
VRKALRIDLFPRIVRFGMVGCVGLCVDVAVLYTCIYMVGMGRYLSRSISYISAATSTWYLNRRVTFADRRGRRWGLEWLRFVMFNGFGGAVNFGVYAIYVHYAHMTVAAPAVAVALGSLAGLTVNYTLSQRFVFQSHQTTTARNPPKDLSS